MSNIVATHICYAEKYKIVLTIGAIGDYAAYLGHIYQTDEEIAARGSKRHDEDVMRKVFCMHIQEGDKYRH